MTGKRRSTPQIHAEIMNCLKTFGKGKVSEIGKRAGIHRAVVWHNCKLLLEAGKINSTEDKHGIIYSLPDAKDQSIAARSGRMVSHGRGRA